VRNARPWREGGHDVRAPLRPGYTSDRIVQIAMISLFFSDFRRFFSFQLAMAHDEDSDSNGLHCFTIIQYVHLSLLWSCSEAKM
jgi:hypothetical protein